MKFTLALLFPLLSLMTMAETPYRRYLLTKVYLHPHVQLRQSPQFPPVTTACIIQRYRIPKGNIFCRMEDKFIHATGVWMKIGVR